MHAINFNFTDNTVDVIVKKIKFKVKTEAKDEFFCGEKKSDKTLFAREAE